MLGTKTKANWDVGILDGARRRTGSSMRSTGSANPRVLDGADLSPFRPCESPRAGGRPLMWLTELFNRHKTTETRPFHLSQAHSTRTHPVFAASATQLALVIGWAFWYGAVGHANRRVCHHAFGRWFPYLLLTGLGVTRGKGKHFGAWTLSAIFSKWQVRLWSSSLGL